MDEWNISEARALAEEKLDADRVRVVKSVGLRLSQVRHVVNQLMKQERVLADPELVSLVKRMIPPVSDEVVLEYALNTQEFFAQHIAPRLERIPVPAIRNWSAELDDALVDTRRIVVQNLSKHPAMKPYRMLGTLREEYDRFLSLEREVGECAREYARLRGEWDALLTAIADARADKSFETLSLMEGSREQLMGEKRAILDRWILDWRKVEPIFTRLLEKSTVFEHMENAQLRILQLYLANPVSARMKDPHGAGFLMLLRLAVQAMEEKKVFPPSEREAARESLLEAMEDPSFSLFFERAVELDRAIEGNLREYLAHPLRRHLSGLETEEHALSRKMQEVQSLGEAVEQRRGEARKSMERLAKDTDEVCRNNLGISIRIPE
ncbi:MAG: hypothetical protein AABW68_00130 [archaeon]